MALTRQQVEALASASEQEVRLYTDRILQLARDWLKMRELIENEINRGSIFENGKLVHLSPEAVRLRQALADIDTGSTETGKG